MSETKTPFKVGETYKTRGGWDASCIYIRKKHDAPLMVMHHMPNGDEVFGTHQPSGRWLASQEAPGDLIPPAPPVKRVPLGPEDVPPGSVVKCIGMVGWVMVTEARDGGVMVEGRFRTWKDMQVWHISTDGTQTWKPMWKEVPEDSTND